MNNKEMDIGNDDQACGPGSKRPDVITGQYDSKEYPLHRYRYHELPGDILQELWGLLKSELPAYRGGVAYTLITNDTQYTLKDVDMIAPHSAKEHILSVLSQGGADKVIVNRNRKGKPVITAFWKRETAYYKLEILLSDIPFKKMRQIDKGMLVYTVTPSYLLADRMTKIAEKAIRQHDDEKTKSHFYVADSLCRFALENRIEIDREAIETIKLVLPAAMQVLSGLIPEESLVSSGHRLKMLIENQ